MTATHDHRPAVAAQRRARMRMRLLETALHVVAARGPVAVTIDDFVAHAQVSRGTFYKYFPDAQGLVEAMAHRVSDELIAHLHPMVEAHDDPAARIASGMLGVLRLAVRLPALGGLLAHLGWPRAEVDAPHAFFTLVGHDLERGLRTRRFAAMDLRLALDLTAAAVIAGAHRLVSEKTPADYPAQVTAACLRGLGITATEARRLADIEVRLPALSEGSMLARLAAMPNGSAGRPR